MSNGTNSSGRSRTWSRRRIAGTALGLAVVVGSGAAANASAHGDGFLSPAAAPAGPVVQAHPTAAPNTWGQQNPNGNGYGTGYGTGVQTPMTSTAPNGWWWTGHGANRWGFQTLVDPADPTFNQALGINGHGVIVGYYGSGKDDMHPNHGWWTKADQRYRDVNYPGAVQTQAVGINDEGTVVGFYVLHDGSNHGFVRWHGQYQTVDAPWTSSAPSFNQLLGISANGIAAGFWNDAAGNAHGYLYNTANHRYRPVRLPWGATSVTVTGVTDDGVVVGFAVIHKATVGFVLTRHGNIVVNLGDHKNTQVLGVNRRGVVVGSFEDGKGRTHGFVWDHGRLRTVDAPHATTTVVNGLSDNGRIVGFFEDASGATKGFLARQ